MTSHSGVTSGAAQGSSPGGEPFDPVDVTWQRVSTKLAAARRISALLVLAVPTAVSVVLAVLVDGRFWWATAVAAVIAVWSWWLIGRQVRAIGYAEREDDLVVRRGIMWRYVVVVPYGRLQYVDVEAGPVDRLFGIAKVQLHTASASTDAAIPGLPPVEAARVRESLSARGQARLAGL